VKLDSVKLGQLEQKNVDAVVVDGDYPEHILLGMTFLDRLKVTKETGKMTLEKKVSSSAAD
jgi:aspartyl protease family protein